MWTSAHFRDRIWFSSVADFNDPFEARVSLSMDGGDDDAWRSEFGVAMPKEDTVRGMIPNLEAGMNREQRSKTTLLTKAAHWRYEQEWRLFRTEHNRGLARYFPGMLAKIIFGCETRADDRNMIMKAMAESSAPVTLCQASRRTSAFALDVHVVSNTN